MPLPQSYHVHRSIGLIRTPYTRQAPYQPPAAEAGDFKIVLEPRFAEGLYMLDTFKYMYVLYALDRIYVQPASLRLRPPWMPDREVGVFASRSPRRPNPIGLSVVEILEIAGNVIRISPIDAFDGTPVLDIKPYLNLLDAKPDANYGWAGDQGDSEHLALHIKGIPHKH